MPRSGCNRDGLSSGSSLDKEGAVAQASNPQRLFAIFVPSPSRREALAEGHQQPRRPLDADAPAQQRPQQAPLFRQEAQPRLTVGGHTEVRLPMMAVLDLQGAVPDRDGRLLRLLVGEREVVDGVQLRRLAPLKRQGASPSGTTGSSGPAGRYRPA